MILFYLLLHLSTEPRTVSTYGKNSISICKERGKKGGEERTERGKDGRRSARRQAGRKLLKTVKMSELKLHAST